MLLVAGISLRNLQPRFWDPEGAHYIEGVRALMVSFTDFSIMPSQVEAIRRAGGLKQHLRIPDHCKIYLDNGAFHTLSHRKPFDVAAYRRLVDLIEPDWYPIPVEYIPHPSMPLGKQFGLYRRTMAYNRKYASRGFVPVIHVGTQFRSFLDCMQRLDDRVGVARLGLGAMVPFLLRSKGADCRTRIVDDIVAARSRLPRTRIHGFGIGGTATLHIATILGLDSVDSSGWRNRAARGIVQLRGTGDRIVANFGKWRGRPLSIKERAMLESCGCGVCVKNPRMIEAGGIGGFAARAAHNLWVLVQEHRDIVLRLQQGSYATWVKTHIDNRIFAPLVEHALTKVRDYASEVQSA